MLKSMSIPDEPGTYALLLANPRTGALRIGRLGTLSLQPGVYVYVGSAFGPGGLAARIGHHRRIAVRPHWHIDYLRAACELTEVWWTTDPARLEHAWAGAVASMPGADVPMPCFGSSDCTCAAHLFWFERQPTARRFTRQLRAASGAADRRGSLTQGGAGRRALPVSRNLSD